MSVAVRAYVGMGSNLGDPPAQLRNGLDALAGLPETRLLAASRFYRSAAWGPVTQPDYVNAVAALETSIPAEGLMQALLAIERAAGRERRERWGPRLLDLDLLLYGEFQIESETLQLPHPRMHERPFVLLPLAELAPNLVLPGHGPIRALLDSMDGSGAAVYSP